MLYQAMDEPHVVITIQCTLQHCQSMYWVCTVKYLNPLLISHWSQTSPALIKFRCNLQLQCICTKFCPQVLGQNRVALKGCTPDVTDKHLVFHLSLQCDTVGSRVMAGQLAVYCLVG